MANLSEKQRKFLDIYLDNPLLPLCEVADMLSISRNTVYGWKEKNINGFADVLENDLNRKWEEAKKMASETMFSLARGGDFKASKYILDYSGFGAEQKIKVDNTTNIKITIGED